MNYSVHAAKTHLSKLIEAVKRGERVFITRHDEAVAELVPVHKGRVRIGSLAGRVTPPPDEFLTPLSDEELRHWDAI